MLPAHLHREARAAASGLFEVIVNQGGTGGSEGNGPIAHHHQRVAQEVPPFGGKAVGAREE